MSYCHHKNVIHRDLKLENILLENSNSSVIKIVDFGIAGLAINVNNIDNMDMGSLRYMAPEVLSKKVKKAGANIDIWAMGVILYALLFGTLPFDGNNAIEII